MLAQASIMRVHTRKLLSLTFVALFALLQLALPSQAFAADSVMILSPTSNASLGSSFTVSGMATPKRTITVNVNNTVVGNTVSANDGSWSLTVSNQTTGEKTIQAVASVQYAYTPNSGDSTISVVNMTTNQVVNTINTDVPLGAGRVSPDGKTLVLYQFLGIGAGSQIRVFSLANPETPTLTNSLTMQATGAFPGMTAPYWADDSSKFYLTNEDFADGDPSYVSIYDGSDFSVAPTNIDAAAAGCTLPIGIAQRPETNIMYLNCASNSSIRSFNMDTNVFTATNIDLTGQGGSGISGSMDFNPDGNTLYLSWAGGPYLYPIDVVNDTVGTRLALEPNANAFQTNSTGSQGVVANSGSGTVSTVDLDSFTLSQTFTTGGTPFLALYNADSTALYITNQTTDQLMVYSATNYNQITTVAVGDTPNALAVSPPYATSTSISVSVASLADTGESRQFIELIAVVAVLLPVIYIVARRLVITSGR